MRAELVEEVCLPGWKNSLNGSIEKNVEDRDSTPSAYRGLSESEARASLLIHGPNELPSERPKSPWKILFLVAREPMVLLLLLCGTIYLASGELREGVPLFGSVLFLILISFFQQAKAERSLQALRDLASPRALVVRDGIERRISGAQVVPKDILLLHEGDRVPADCELLETNGLRVDESQLTGESAPVSKHAAEREAAYLFSTSLVVAGRAVARVLHTGRATEIGKIGDALQARDASPSRLEHEVSSLVWRFGLLGGAVSILVAALYARSYHDWSDGLLAGLASAMSLLPEEFPLVLTIFFAVGAWRMSKRRVLTRELRAIETLGAISTLCVDKTGTLTLNQMKLSQLSNQHGQRAEIALGTAPEAFHDVLRFGALASQVDALDPMDRAIRVAFERDFPHTDRVHQGWALGKEYPLSHELMAVTCAWRSTPMGRWVVASKGAPEAVVGLCRMSAEESSRVESLVREMSSQGLRVLGVAKATILKDTLPVHPGEFEFEFVGLLALEDPIRDEVLDSVRVCHQAGIKVIMLTGDHPDTASAIAQKAGIGESVRVMTGPELEHLNDLELRSAIRCTSVFARVAPIHKLRIINALKANGEVVGMTGDGVNDAPALKWADVGISMGKRGTDVAREASDLVLLDDDFSSIVSAIWMGRRIYENVMRAFVYIFAIHVPIAGLVILPILLKQPLILFPAHIVFLELIIDPASSLAFEAEPHDERLMHRPPRNPAEPALGFRRIYAGLGQGSLVLLICIFAWSYGRSLGGSESQVRSLAFSTLVLGNLALILANLPWRSFFPGHRDHLRSPRNLVALAVVAGAVVLLVTAQTVPWLRELLRMSALGTAGWASSVGLALLAGLGARALQYASERRPLESKKNDLTQRGIEM